MLIDSNRSTRTDIPEA